MIRAVLFDIDDTLIHFDSARAADAFRAGAQRTYDYLKSRDLTGGGKLPSFEKFYHQHAGITWRSKWIARLTGREQSTRHTLRKLCLKLRLQRDEVSLSRLGWLWYEPLVECARVAPDVIPTLTGLRDAGVRLGIICNTPLQGEVIDKHLELEGLLEFFRVRIYSSDVAWRKPDRRIFEAALRELAVRASEALYVGDSVKCDVAGAQNAGIKSVLLSQHANNGDAASADHSIYAISDLLTLTPLGEMLESRMRYPVATPPDIRSSVA
jgi:FMN phosphatase YigB (HAD superfamily)